MGFSTKASILAAALLATAAHGHMIMKSPVPYGKATLNNSPLEPDGSDFPCKQRSGVYVKDGAPNVMAIGEQQTLSFTGSAVHGGGSCQIALSTDTQPTKDSKWMVIKSIIGGCPASVPGNLPEDANGSGASTFQYSIPAGIAPGEYALSWTWFNKVGNREMYQNCASVTVTAATKKRYVPAPKSAKRQTSFPDLFRCNLGDGCVTPANVDIIFPNPGAEVQSVGAGPFSQMPGGAGGAAGQGPPQTPATATAAETQVPSAATTPPAYNGGQGGGPAATATGFASGFGGNGSGGNGGGNGGSNGGSNGSNGGGGGLYTVSAGNFAEGASSQGPVTPVTIETPAPTAAADSGSSAGGCEVGSWDCQDSGTSFRRCVSGGTWSATIDMAAGTKCVPGISAEFAEVVGKVKKRHHSHHFRFLDSFH